MSGDGVGFVKGSGVRIQKIGSGVRISVLWLWPGLVLERGAKQRLGLKSKFGYERFRISVGMRVRASVSVKVRIGLGWGWG